MWTQWRFGCVKGNFTTAPLKGNCFFGDGKRARGEILPNLKPQSLFNISHYIFTFLRTLSCAYFFEIMEDNEENQHPGGPQEADRVKQLKKRRDKKRKRMPVWLSWGLTILVLSFVLSVLFSFLTEITINDSSIYLCIAVLIVLLVLNVGCDIIANAVLSCDIDGFNAMASRKIRGARRAVAFCKNSEKIASIFSDVIGDICGIISGSAGAVLAGYFIANDSVEGMAVSIAISAVIGALTVGGKAFGKPISIKYNSKIAFGFAKFTTFFVKEK